MVSRKKIALIVSCLLCAVLLCVSSFAAVLGDVDNDAKLTAADARLVLRQAVGLEHFNDTQKTAADVDFDKKITASDARLVLRAAVGLETLQQMNNDRGDVTVTVNGIAVTKVPYTKNGLTIESVSFDGNKLSCVFKNDTSETVSSSSNVEYKLYNAAGTVIESSYITTGDMKAGEQSTNYLFITDDTAKVIFGNAETSKGIDFANLPTEDHSGIQITKLPYSYKGITIESVEVDKEYDRLYCVAKNVSGSAIQDITDCSYRCYDASGKILKTSYFYLEDLNNGEKCKPYFTYPEGTVKIQFGEIDVRKDEHHADNATSTYSGLKCFPVPYTTQGVTLRFTGFNSSRISYLIDNKSGKPLSTVSFEIKYYDKNGFVIRTDTVAALQLNNGETFSGTFLIPEEAVKMVMQGVKKTEADKNYNVTSVVSAGTYKVSALPYNAQNVMINSVSVNGRNLTFVCENKTGKNVSNTTRIAYREFDSNGYVISTGGMRVEAMNNGEKCYSTIYLSSNAAKVIFDKVTLYDADKFTLPAKTEIKNGLKINVFPFEENGLRVNSCEYDSAKRSVTLNVSNTSGGEVSSSSKLMVKEYDAKGIILNSGIVYTERMNAGESCNVKISVDDTATALYIVAAASVK